jgi:hypothetical protein
MGLYRAKVQNIFTGSYICCPEQMIPERSTYQGKKTHKKKPHTAREIIARNKKIFVKKQKFTSSLTRGLATLEGEKSITKAKEVDK